MLVPTPPPPPPPPVIDEPVVGLGFELVFEPEAEGEFCGVAIVVSVPGGAPEVVAVVVVDQSLVMSCLGRSRWSS